MWWMGALLACQTRTPGADRVPDDTGPPVPTTETGSEDSDPPTDSGVPKVDAPNIAAVLGDCAGAQVVPSPYPNQLQQGVDLHRVALQDPLAVCNDGSPAPIYVRAATNPLHANDWVMHLQGGSECITYEECAIRWCGSDYYDASKMSSNYNPETIRGVGIHNIDLGTNAFSGWNHVFFYYCSSDLWQGQSLATVTRADGLSTYSLPRRGHTILEATLTLAEAGAISDDGSQILPTLSAATNVLFTGSSAGSIGAGTNLDWVASRLPGARVIGVLDAAVAPDTTLLRADLAATVHAENAARYGARDAAEAVRGFGDASCEAALPDDLDWQCRASSSLPYQWISTPFLARMDLYDPPTGGVYMALGATQQEFADSVVASLAEISAVSSDGGDHPGVFGPACAEHLGLEVDAQFMAQPIEGPAGPVTLHDAVLAQLARPPVALIDVDGTRSSCPR